MKMQKGSFTIEAVIWIPLMLFVMVGVLQEGIYCYKVCAEQEIPGKIENWDSVSGFYDVWGVKELEEEIKDEQSAD